jgi:hypothetical protein
VDDDVSVDRCPHVTDHARAIRGGGHVVTHVRSKVLIARRSSIAR